ncbi:hypothetical protein JCM11491_001820 [Sporobolomyces phaffii]
MSQTTFASLCRASKRFLPLARSFLYYRPISPTSTVTWKRALALLASLSSATGHLVVSLDGIVDYVAEIGTLEEPRFPLSFQLQGETEAFSLYHAILEACPRLETVDFICTTKQHLSKLLRALDRSSSTLNTVKFANSPFARDYRINTVYARMALKRKQMRGIKHVCLDGVLSSSRRSDDPLTDLTLESFSLRLYSITNHQRLQFFPRDPSNLKTFSIELASFSFIGLSWILDYLPDTLSELSLSHYDLLGRSVPDLGNYTGTAHPHHSIFAKLTSLTNLSMHDVHDLSLDLLDVLVSSSPLLSTLDFAGSRWVPPQTSASNPTRVGDTITGVFDPDDGLARLTKFQHLRRAHLGYLPTTNRQTYARLVATMNERKVNVDWDLYTNYPFCSGCGSHHRV